MIDHPFAEVRESFPILHRSTYLASHSLGAVPTATREALDAYYGSWANEGIRAWEGTWWEAIEAFNRDIEQVLGADEGTVAPMQNATRAMAAVLSCFDWSGERNKIVMTDQEFTTSYPLICQLEDQGAEVVLVEAEEDEMVPVEAIAEAVDKQTRIVHTCHVYFRSGAIQDLAAVTKAAHQEGAYMLADGYQAAGTVPVDVGTLGVDFYVGGSHKWLCGGPGAGYLYVRPQVIGRVRPRLTGWFGLEAPFSYEADTTRGKPHAGIQRFLGGTPNVPGIYAAREGIRTLLEAGLPEVRDYTMELSKLVGDLAVDAGYTLTGPEDPKDRSAMVTFELDGSQWKAKRLTEQGTIVDARPDCGMRVSTHFYNNEQDVRAFFEALGRL